MNARAIDEAVACVAERLAKHPAMWRIESDELMELAGKIVNDDVLPAIVCSEDVP